ncbi:CMGC protein kinase [Penicillium cataractarum]|uniref:CMGC protein kinase n=1 Tax=Penicillium cataractarum TaxID=2100454 RepID=A0A9W9V282_9EURO|nr:CMGC protein kinase [Penicillium cataractarum]KAJ5363805.1 CMGC protein kinase [Penicillium cataractarum]
MPMIIIVKDYTRIESGYLAKVPISQQDKTEDKQHLAEMIDLFGPFLKPLLDKGKPDIVQSMFYGEGKFKDAPLIDRPGLMSEAFTPGLDKEVRERFVSFLLALMKTSPEERPMPEDLLRHP